MNHTAATRTPITPRIGTQSHRVLAAMAAAGPQGLTHPEFQSMCGSWRMASPICTLRRDGWNITDQWERTHGRRIKRYFLVWGDNA